ncbi:MULTISPECIES: ferritin [Flavobacterium]|jgi:ferritin|uniref:Ferritin n=1 Tax=Flavobacterium cupriresistens TaxID=2893885 RepID=A0ABU4RFW3_9FLAO|nr:MULTISPECIES: ferritin [unclassified Flavobacterium]KLT69578.1 ferritin [Flavobacterium sp. ABG]MDX6191489.1 ferritin [Flavobacterium sp. Fl-318]UFH43253.1 ferritin [Flavobacterium sp. F-323]
MKDLLRTSSSLVEGIEKILNLQSKIESDASNKYLAMAAWLDRNGFANTASHMYKQAEEEREHFLKVFKYITDMGGIAITPTVSEVQQEFASFKNVFEIALQNEIAVTQAVNKVIAKCRAENDYATENFMMWYVVEQREEEKNARRALELFELINENDAAGKFELDLQISKIG